ncbi:MAG: aldehyde dehydrogenase family protein [Thermoplasmatota archaeon]
MAPSAQAVIRPVNPATGQVVAEIPTATMDDVRGALEAARTAQPLWAARPVGERMAILARLQQLVLRDRTQLAALVTSEMGKPTPEALAADLIPVLDAIAFVRREAPRFLEGRPSRIHNLLLFNRKSRIEHAPAGVVGIVAPWNYPLAIPGSQIVAALGCGNAVVVKPASATPSVLIRFAELAHEAGVPREVLRVLVGAGTSVGRAMAEAPFDRFIFTGSVEVGRAVDTARHLAGLECALELGGSDPAIILEDANLDLAAQGVVWARFANAGQTCAAAKRAFVVESAADRFIALVKKKVEELRVGDGSQPDIEMGPLIDAKAVDAMDAFVQDAVARGARILTGGSRLKDRPGFFYAPTVLVDVPADARVLREEVFGPVLPIVRVANEAEAIARANDTTFGLTASVWTRNRARGRAVASQIQAGTVTVNDHVYTFAATETPWMGRKDSGTGATHGFAGLEHVTVARHVNESPGRPLWPNLWWFPYDGKNARTWSKGLPFLYGRGLRRYGSGPGLARDIIRKRKL